MSESIQIHWYMCNKALKCTVWSVYFNGSVLQDNICFDTCTQGETDRSNDWRKYGVQFQSMVSTRHGWWWPLQRASCDTYRETNTYGYVYLSWYLSYAYCCWISLWCMNLVTLTSAKLTYDSNLLFVSIVLTVLCFFWSKWCQVGNPLFLCGLTRFPSQI